MLRYRIEDLEDGIYAAESVGPAEAVRTTYFEVTEAAVRRCLDELRRTRAEVFVPNMVTPALLAVPQARALGVPAVSVLHNDDDEYRAKASLPADATVCISRGLARLVPADGRLVRSISYGLPAGGRRARPPAPGAPGPPALAMIIWLT